MGSRTILSLDDYQESRRGSVCFQLLWEIQSRMTVEQSHLPLYGPSLVVATCRSANDGHATDGGEEPQPHFALALAVPHTPVKRRASESLFHSPNNPSFSDR